MQKQKNWHNLSESKVLEILKSKKNGLSFPEIKKRQKKFGRNQLPSERKAGALFLFFSQFKSSLVYILLVAALISFFLGHKVDMSVILLAVFVNVIVGFVQEYKAQKALDALQKIIVLKTRVWRNGQEAEINVSDLIPGDIVVLSAGDRLPADGRLLEVSQLKIDEAGLTGESVAIDKTIKVLDLGTVLADRRNCVFMGTSVVAGTGLMIVTEIGKKTEFGEIALLLKETKKEVTPLQKRINRFSRWLSWLVLLATLVTFVFGVVIGQDAKEMFLVAVALAVSAVPEGLIVGVTVTLAIGMQKILKRNALVSKLVAAETLGSTTVICTDKTGTVTEGEMKVVKVLTSSKQDFNFSSVKKEEIVEAFEILKIGLLNSDSFIENPDAELEHRRIIGSPTEKALIMAGAQVGLVQGKVLAEQPLLDKIPFSPDDKYMVTLHSMSKTKNIIYIKGAPEKILEMSSSFYSSGSLKKMSEESRQEFQRLYEKLSKQGLRLLAFAKKNTSVKNKNFQLDTDKSLIKDFEFLGLVAIKDPVRDGVNETIKLARQAGIKTILITGDHKFTAQAIAREIGLKAESKNILDGIQLAKMTDTQLKKKIREITVYARVTPHDKLRIIDAWQAVGEVVAMTGDGINDAPAIKSADIGLALGSGTDVTKKTADLILLDNNFATIVAAIRQGRIIFANIRKMILYLLSDSFTEILLVVSGLLLRMPLPILATQILWINLIDDSLPATSLAIDPGEKGIMEQKPIKSNAGILDSEGNFLIVFISVITGFFTLGVFYYILKTTGDLEKARTIVFTILAIDSLLYIFSCRSLKYTIFHTNFWNNRYLLGAVAIGFLLQIAVIYLGFLQKLFYTVPLNLQDWGIVAMVSLTVIVLIEITKYIFIVEKRPKLR